MKELEVTLRVVIGEEEVERLPAESVLVGGWEEPDYDDRPNAVMVKRRVVVLFGDGPPSKAPRRSKTLAAFGRIEQHEPTEVEWQEATERARSELAALVRRHGLEKS